MMPGRSPTLCSTLSTGPTRFHSSSIGSAAAACRSAAGSTRPPYLAQCGTLAKTTHAARLASLPAPQQYAAAELFRGSMVTHAFIAYRAGESPSFTISANMIPIPLPWTVCVREHQPPGSVAVLINRAHTFTDLVLPINAAQDRLLSLADGNRTLAQIIQMSREDGQRALDFFEQLWRYDQVVFDASRA